KNMADTVWETMTLYGLREKIIAMMLDNASNNDTLVKSIKSHCKKEGIMFDARLSRLRCMPHTVHLAAIKLLEAIGVVSKKTAKRATGQSSNYQDAAMAPVDRSNDTEATLQGMSINNSIINYPDALQLCKIVWAVCSSPQCKQAWLREVKIALESWNDGANAMEQALMLILDVATRWSSTHQMLCMYPMIS
ncbi:hypothetical protein IW261DRAFT_1344152, partial [Armillaria novae-zelandiae]